MGCTPSKSTVTYSQDGVYRDMDTCSTFVPSLKSSVSTPERPTQRMCLDNNSGNQAFLSVPGRDVHGRSVSQSSCPEARSSSPSCCSTEPEPHTDAAGGCGTG